MNSHLATPLPSYSTDSSYQKQIAALKETTAAINASYAVDPENERIRPVSIQGGIATLEDGETVDLLKIQAACSRAFRDTGEMEFMDATNELSKLTGMHLGTNGQWFSL